MGRHSAPDDDAAEPAASVESAVAVVTSVRGRHARVDDDPVATDDTAKIARIDLDVVPDAPTETLLAATGRADLDEAAPKKKPRERATAADVALVRQHADVRARVIAAVLVPFAIYTAALAAIGKLDRSYLLWIWIPLISAGLLVGLFLDMGHRKYRG